MDRKFYQYAFILTVLAMLSNMYKAKCQSTIGKKDQNEDEYGDVSPAAEEGQGAPSAIEEKSEGGGVGNWFGKSKNKGSKKGKESFFTKYRTYIIIFLVVIVIVVIAGAVFALLKK